MALGHGSPPQAVTSVLRGLPRWSTLRFPSPSRAGSPARRQPPHWPPTGGLVARNIASRVETGRSHGRLRNRRSQVRILSGAFGETAIWAAFPALERKFVCAPSPSVPAGFRWVPLFSVVSLPISSPPAPRLRAERESKPACGPRDRFTDLGKTSPLFLRGVPAYEDGRLFGELMDQGQRMHILSPLTAPVTVDGVITVYWPEMDGHSARLVWMRMRCKDEPRQVVQPLDQTGKGRATAVPPGPPGPAQRAVHQVLDRLYERLLGLDPRSCSERLRTRQRRQWSLPDMPIAPTTRGLTVPFPQASRSTTCAGCPPASTPSTSKRSLLRRTHDEAATRS